MALPSLLTDSQEVAGGGFNPGPPGAQAVSAGRVNPGDLRSLDDELAEIRSTLEERLARIQCAERVLSGSADAL